jgi:hypothetical protein
VAAVCKAAIAAAAAVEEAAAMVVAWEAIWEVAWAAAWAAEIASYTSPTFVLALSLLDVHLGFALILTKFIASIYRRLARSERFVPSSRFDLLLGFLHITLLNRRSSKRCCDPR